MVLWQQHANSVNELYFNSNNYPFNELYSAVVVKLHPFNTWYFGTLAQRLDFNNYMIILKRISKEMLSVIGILFLVSGFLAFVKKRMGTFFYIWLLSVLCSIMLIFNLNVVHNFYQLPLVPILAIFCGAGATYLIEFFKNKRVILTVIAILVSSYFVMSCFMTVKLFRKENNLLEVGQFINKTVERNAMIATSLPDQDLWCPTLMYYADRHGFNVPHMRLNEEMIKYLRNKNIKYLTLVDYKGGDDSINATLFPYRIVSENDRTKIYDIFVR